jgi:hypothetical protein
MRSPGNALSGHQTNRSHSRKLHKGVSSACRARLITELDLVDCMTESLFHCEHRLHFGTCHYCMHPQKLEIVAHTNAVAPA